MSIHPDVTITIPGNLTSPPYLRGLRTLLDATRWSFLADEIEGRANPKPPRIPEPGWGAIVEAGVEQHDERLLWTPNDQGFWACKNPDEYARHWPELIAPVLVRDGIKDGVR